MMCVSRGTCVCSQLAGISMNLTSPPENSNASTPAGTLQAVGYSGTGPPDLGELYTPILLLCQTLKDF